MSIQLHGLFYFPSLNTMKACSSGLLQQQQRQQKQKQQMQEPFENIGFKNSSHIHHTAASTPDSSSAIAHLTSLYGPVALEIMLKNGWKTEGLGRKLQGIVEPITVK